jgi:hypothetical protein
VTSWIVRLLRVASFVICAIVVLSFAVFALDKTKTASSHQTEAVSGRTSAASEKGTGQGHEGAVHKAIDETSEQLTSPFAGIISGADSEWANRGVRVLLALLVYGFGLGFLARTLRVRT